MEIGSLFSQRRRAEGEFFILKIPELLFPGEERVKLCENFTSLNLPGDNWVSRAGCLWKSPFLTLSDIEWQKQMFPKPCCNEVERTRHQVRAKILRHDGSRNNYSAKSKAKREGERYSGIAPISVVGRFVSK
ncbi:hypothetical protein TNIN_85131 [Trichonephila inaurata madagascariensis]|uniref:Uncharacterized protein n=1 Tax=Trichonephila inaurata madagascariensis TaxID=2747483 RepID=A0A8X6XS37_9ARAC|nr:hypothetical protein TNIN_85131 [Trichonephila inaurata madagascariensis]